MPPRFLGDVTSGIQLSHYRHIDFTRVTPPILLSLVLSCLVMESPTSQLFDTLSDSIERALKLRRPILTHLNADTTWLLQLPYPQDALPITKRSRYNIILDPWFRGPQSDVAAWFSTQWHSIESCVQNVHELNERLRDVDRIEARNEIGRGQSKTCTAVENASEPYVDAIVVSHEFTDHCNKNTLLEFHSETPVFAVGPAAELISSWDHFKVVQSIPSFASQDPDWRKSSLQTLPNWLGISRITTKSDALYYHSAILIAFDLSTKSSSNYAEIKEEGEGIIYTPHGIHAQDLGPLRCATPPLRTLALLHGLHDVFLNPFQQLNLGAHNGLRAQRICGAKYWISTHDEVKQGRGLVAFFLRRKVITLQEAMLKEEEVEEEAGENDHTDTNSMFANVTFAELCNGESILLT